LYFSIFLQSVAILSFFSHCKTKRCSYYLSLTYIGHTMLSKYYLVHKTHKAKSSRFVLGIMLVIFKFIINYNAKLSLFLCATFWPLYTDIIHEF
jgi:hypothetical protein